MTWFKTNSYTITKMVLNQFGVMLMGIILVNILTAKMPTLMLLTSVYSTGFYMILLYVMTWEQGAKDRIRVDAGHTRLDRLAGLKLSLWANIPNFLIAVLLLVGFLFGTCFSQQPWAQGMFGVTHVVAICWESMYTGFVNNLLDPAVTSSMSVGYVIAYAITPLPALVASTVGYWMGSCNRRMFGFLTAKKEQ